MITSDDEFVDLVDDSVRTALLVCLNSDTQWGVRNLPTLYSPSVLHTFPHLHLPMSAIGNVALDESDGSLRIESIELEDDELVQFLTQFEDSKRSDVVLESVTIGLRTIQLMDTTQDVEYIERRLGMLEEELVSDVEEFQEELDEMVGEDGDLQEALDSYVGDDGQLQRHIEDAFGDDGPFVERLDEELGEDGERIQQALDPDKEGSPTYRLEQRLKDEIKSIREKIVEEETEADLRSRTYLKGGDFEDSVGQILGEIVRQTANDVEFTGDTTGEIGRDVGDFVVKLAGTDQNIVVEAKTESKSVQRIKGEMEEALRNRDAAYGIFVTDTLENLPATKTGWFHEFPEYNSVVVAMSETAEEEIEPGYLRIAFHWARMRAVQEYAEVGSGFDPGELRSEVSEIEEEIKRFKAVRGQCEEIKKSRKSIEDTLDDIEGDIKQRLGEIEAELSKADDA